MLGEILIAGMAAMLICIFLGPKFIEYLRLREFGQQIREEGPQEHHEKAGTPTMGGLIIFTAIAIPYLVLSDRSTSSLAVFGVALGCALIGFVDDFLKITRRRSLGLSARYKLLFQAALALGLWYVAKQLRRARLEPRAAHLPRFARHPGLGLSDRDLPGDRRLGQRGQPHRRTRWPRGRLLRDRPARLYRDHLHHLRRARPVPALGHLRRGLHRLPLVQRLPGVDLHGGHRLARAGGRDRRAWL